MGTYTAQSFVFTALPPSNVVNAFALRPKGEVIPRSTFVTVSERACAVKLSFVQLFSARLSWVRTGPVPRFLKLPDLA